MTDRTAAEVMCCPEGCALENCCAHLFKSECSRIRKAGYMIVPREPTKEMLRAAGMRQQPSLGEVYPSIYRAMTTEGELK